MAGNDPVDQDAIAAQWEASLDSEDPAEAARAAAANELSGTMALQWAAMVEDGSRDFGSGKNGGERVLSQEEIDNLLGFSAGDGSLDDHSGIRAIIDSAMVSYERLPMLEIVFDRLLRLMTSSLPANAAILVRLRIDMEDRGGNVELLLPYATIEPIRSVLLQMFMGEKFGRDPIWEGHFATEVAQAQISVDAVLYEADIPLKQLMKLKVGDTLPLEMRREALVQVRCGNVLLTVGRMGRVGHRVAIRVTKQLRKPNTTFAMFEKADEQTKLMEAQ